MAIDILSSWCGTLSLIKFNMHCGQGWINTLPQVCQSAHRRLYGIGSGIIQNIRSGKPGFTMEHYRLTQAKHPTLGISLRTSPNQKWQHILAFFWTLYISVAEILPTKFNMPSDATLEDKARDPDFQERYCIGFLQNLDSQFETVTPEHVGPGSFKGPRRFLEHARPIDLFYQYVGLETSYGREPAALSTFMRLYKQVFEQHLRFRGKTEHPQCDICQRLKRRISEADSRVQREELTKQYSRHILSQWLDRQVYWKLRALSQSYFSSLGAKVDAQIHSSIYSSVLTAILDGMDQSKLRCPKFGFERVSKSIAKLHRPALHLAGLWLHGYKLFLPITDENTKKNSETQIEYLMRGLSQLVTEQSTLPLGLHLQQDNCYREGKNQYLFAFGLVLTILGCFRWVSLGYLRTAHSHDDIDQVFGQISRLLVGKTFDTPNELASLLNRLAGGGDAAGATRSRLRGSVAHSFKVDQVAEWHLWLRQLGITVRGLSCLVQIWDFTFQVFFSHLH